MKTSLSIAHTCSTALGFASRVAPPRRVFRQRLRLIAFFGVLAFVLCACGGEPSQAEIDESPAPPPSGIEDGEIVPADPNATPLPAEEIALLPQVNAGSQQFADPNVVINLRGTARAQGSASITEVLWLQTSGPRVVIPNAGALENLLLLPDVQEPTVLSFRLYAEDSEGRVNSDSTRISINPTPAFLRVLGTRVAEDAGTAIVRVVLAAPQSNDFTVNYRTVAGTAAAGEDFGATQGSLNFAAGTVEQSITIAIFDNEPLEGDEYFNVQASYQSADQPASVSGIVLIANNPDLAPMRDLRFSLSGPQDLTVGQRLSNPVDPTSVQGSGAIMYSSSDTAVASVDGEGRVSALSAGIAEITATQAADADFPFVTSASFSLNVSPPARQIAFSLAGPIDLVPGDNLANPIDNSSIQGSGGIAYASSNPAVATVDSLGVVSALAEGNAVISATQAADATFPSASEARFDLSVAAATNPQGFEIPVSRLGASTANISLFLSMALRSGSATVDWNDGSPRQTLINQSDDLLFRPGGLLAKGYPSTSDNATFTISVSDGLEALRAVAVRGNLQQEIGIYVALPALEYLNVSGQVNGALSDLSNATRLRSLFISNGQNQSATGTIGGALSDLPRALEVFSANDSGTSTPPNVYSGTLGDLPTNLLRLSLSAANDVGGDLADLNIAGVQAIEALFVGGSNTISGDVAALPASLTSLGLQGSNTISGDVAQLPRGLLSLNVAGNNTLGGDVAGLPAALLSLNLNGANVLSGDIAGFPASLSSITVQGQNTLSGDISGFNSELNGNIFITGVNTVSGNIADFSAGSQQLAIRGQNTISGNLADIPATITNLNIEGVNTLSGNVQDLPPLLTNFDVKGSNTIAGDLGLIANTAIRRLTVVGNNVINDFSSAPTWQPLNPVNIDLRGSGGGYSSDQLDAILIYLSSVLPTATTGTTLRFARAQDAPRTAASNDAVAQLTSARYRIFTNLLSQSIAFATSEPAFGVLGTQIDRPISDTGAGTGDIRYISLDQNIATVDANGVVTIVGLGQTRIRAIKAADATYDSAEAEYIINGVIGETDLNPATNLISEGGFELNEINDGITSDAFPFNGFSSNSDTGTIDFTFTGASYDLTGFLLWNDINVRAEGVRSFELNFYRGATRIDPGFTQTYTTLVGNEGVDAYTFPITVFDITRVEMVILSSSGGIEIREVAFRGVISNAGSSQE